MTITLAEYARKHNINLQYLARLNRKNKLPTAVKVGSTWLIEEDTPLPERRKYIKK